MVKMPTDNLEPNPRSLIRSEFGTRGKKQPKKPITKMFKKDIHANGQYYHLKFDIPYMYKSLPQKVTVWFSDMNKHWRVSINTVIIPDIFSSRLAASKAAIATLREIGNQFRAISLKDLTQDQ